jgi:hypothetical protein
MDDLFDSQRFAAIGAAIYEWLSANVLVPDNAIQLAVLVATFGVALPLARQGRSGPRGPPRAAAARRCSAPSNVCCCH